MTPAADGPTRATELAPDPVGSAERARGTLGATAGPLVADHDVLLLDLDGTVWLGGELIPQALPVLSRLADGGVRLVYVTNNASRSPAEVAAQLTGAGLATDVADVVTSAQAAASLLAERVAPGSPVLIVGSDALEAEATARRLRPVRFGDLHAGRLTSPGPDGSDRVAAVLQGLSHDTGWRDLAAASHAVADGALWVAANVDATLPTAEGLSPGNGSLVAVVAAVTGKTPVVAGKPERPLLDAAVQRSGARRPLVVGDRLNTDLAAAVATDLPGLLVLTGVSRARDLLAAPPSQRPRYVGADLRALEAPHQAPRPVGGGWECGPWRAEVRAGVVSLTASGSERTVGPEGTVGPDVGGGDGVDSLAGLRVLAEAVWEHVDSEGVPPSGVEEAVGAVDAAAAADTRQPEQSGHDRTGHDRMGHDRTGHAEGGSR